MGRPALPEQQQTERISIRLPRWALETLRAHGEVGALMRQQGEALARALGGGPDDVLPRRKKKKR